MSRSHHNTMTRGGVTFRRSLSLAGNRWVTTICDTGVHFESTGRRERYLRWYVWIHPDKNTHHYAQTLAEGVAWARNQLEN